MLAAPFREVAVGLERPLSYVFKFASFPRYQKLLHALDRYTSMIIHSEAVSPSSLDFVFEGNDSQLIIVISDLPSVARGQGLEQCLRFIDAYDDIDHLSLFINTESIRGKLGLAADTSPR